MLLNGVLLVLAGIVAGIVVLAVLSITPLATDPVSPQYREEFWLMMAGGWLVLTCMIYGCFWAIVNELGNRGRRAVKSARQSVQPRRGTRQKSWC